MTPTINLETVILEAGEHEPGGKFCVMELAAYIANEPWSDHPECVSPVLGAFLRVWDDGLDDETRQRLKPYAERILNTDGDGRDEERAWLATDWLVRVCAPAFLDLAGLTKDAKALRTLKPLGGTKTARSAQAKINKASDAAYAARAAAAANTAWAAAWAAAADAARAAARDAAWAAAGAAAGDGDAAWEGDAAWTAAADTARAAAGAAARATALNAARAAAGDKLQPTVTALQTSAFELLDRMIIGDQAA